MPTRGELVKLLEDCAEAFEAIPTAAASRKVLKKLGQAPVAYSGNGSHILAKTMAKEIRRVLDESTRIAVELEVKA